jgi:hypothetical protein
MAPLAHRLAPPLAGQTSALVRRLCGTLSLRMAGLLSMLALAARLTSRLLPLSVQAQVNLATRDTGGQHLDLDRIAELEGTARSPAHQSAGHLVVVVEIVGEKMFGSHQPLDKGLVRGHECAEGSNP